MEPPSGVPSYSPAVPAGALRSINYQFPQVASSPSNEQLHNRIEKVYTSHYKLRFPFEAPIPIFHIDAIVSKILKIGTFQFPGYGITLSTPQKTLQFETSDCFNIIKPENELLAYPVEALEHILALLKLPHSGVEVKKVKDHQYLSWGSLDPNPEIWGVQCFSLEFTHNGQPYHFYFDTKLRFFKNVQDPSRVYLRHPLLNESDRQKCLQYASEQLNLPDLKITRIIPDQEDAEIGYQVEINGGLLNLFVPVLPNY